MSKIEQKFPKDFVVESPDRGIVKSTIWVVAELVKLVVPRQPSPSSRPQAATILDALQRVVRLALRLEDAGLVA